MNTKKLLFILVCWGMFCSAQNVFELSDVSKTYHVIVNAERCNGKICEGKAMIDLYDKSTMKKYQTLSSENFYLELNENRKPSVDSLKNSIIFDDFNFDGFEDVAVRDRSSGHGNLLFDVYLNNNSETKFALHQELTDLVTANSGMFTIDSERKLIVSHLKNGCCWNLTSEYQYIPERGLLKVLEFEEDTRNSKEVKTIKREFIDYKWFAKTTIYPRKLYFKEEKNENTERN